MVGGIGGVSYIVVQTRSGAINKSIGLDSAQRKELIGTSRAKFSEGFKDRAVEVKAQIKRVFIVVLQWGCQ